MTDTNKSNAEFYKETVFLPTTDFSMRAGLAQKEPEILKKWQEIDLYKKLRETSKDKEKFILHDGPPYANGNIHIGHAMNKVLKDVICKTMQMRGYNAPYVPGWDCHGLPIEWKIEEQYRKDGKDKDNVDPLVFRKECRDFAQKWVDIQSEQFERLGVVGNWKDPYLTMTNRAESLITKEIHKFLDNRLLYEGAKPIMWSVVEKTALAEAEIEYKEHKSITIWVKFPVENTAGYKELENASIVIWTTTPWTIPGNLMVAFNEDIDYAVYEVLETEEGSMSQKGEKLVLAVNLAEDVKSKAKITSWKETPIKAQIGGFDNIELSHPFKRHGYPLKNEKVFVEHANFVTEDQGTGFVHIAPGHGEDDFNLYMNGDRGYEDKNGLVFSTHMNDLDRIPKTVDDDGKYYSDVPLFAGLEVYTQKGELGNGNFAVLKQLVEENALLAKGSIRHEYPHSWRSKTPLIFRTTPQWFIAMDGQFETKNLRDLALKAIEDTRWVPEKGEKRIHSMISNRPDWCISRQRSWGVPIAFFKHKDDNRIIRNKELLDRIVSVFEEEGSDAWWAKDNNYFLKGIDLGTHNGEQIKPENLEKVFDIVDVWFESGCTHSFVVEDRPEELGQRADLYLEGSDQHRGWFHSSLLESCGTRGEAPYKAVLTHGFVLDEKGYKMSKSLGNIVDPLDVMNEYGADILRLWALISDYQEDIRISNDTMKMTSDLYRRLRNTLRFLLGALNGFTRDEMIDRADYSKMPELEQLVLHQLTEMQKKITQHSDNFEFGKIMHALHNFCNSELSAFYLDIRKDRLYCDRPDLFERRAHRTVLAEIYRCLVSWLAPVLSYTAEEAWGLRPEGVFEDVESVHMLTFPDLPESWNNAGLAGKWFAIRHVRDVVLGALEPRRAAKDIGSSLEAAPVIYVNDDYAKAIEGQDMADICIVSQVDIRQEDVPEDAFTLNEYKGLGVVFAKAKGQKCQRSWKILPEVGQDKDYPDLSPRDADAVRWYASQKKAA